jgi:chromate reductase
VVGVALMGRPEIYFQSRPGAIDDELNFTDERVKTNLNIWVDQFVQWIGRFASPRVVENDLERRSA